MFEIKSKDIETYQLPSLVQEALKEYYTDSDIDRKTLFARYHRMAAYDKFLSEEMNDEYDNLLVDYYADAMMKDPNVSPLPPTWAFDMLKCCAQVLRTTYDCFTMQEIIKTYPQDVKFIINFLIDVWNKPIQRNFSNLRRN